MEDSPRVEIGASRTKRGSVAAADVNYFNSWAFRNLADETRRTRKNILKRFREHHGDKRIALLQPDHLKAMLTAKAGMPQAANNFLKTVRALMQHCIVAGMRTDDPPHGIKGVKVKTNGYRTWTEADIEAFEARHPIGSRARLALALLLYTAQRRSESSAWVASTSATVRCRYINKDRKESRAPRKIAATGRTPQNCLQMIPLRSRSDSLTFTARWPAIGSESNFSRCPYGGRQHPIAFQNNSGLPQGLACRPEQW
jgi:hypothetical protein